MKGHPVILGHAPLAHTYYSIYSRRTFNSKRDPNSPSRVCVVCVSFQIAQIMLRITGSAILNAQRESSLLEQTHLRS